MNCEACLLNRHGECWHDDWPELDEDGYCQHHYNIVTAAEIVAFEYAMGVRE